MRIHALSAATLAVLICWQSDAAHSAAISTASPLVISIKMLHLLFMAIWVAGLAYLPSLFIAHSTAADEADTERIKSIERLLFFWIATPGGVLTIIFGIWLTGYGFEGGWLPAKLLLVSLMVFFHLYCGRLILRFRHDLPPRGPIFFRALNQIPLILLVAVVFLAVAKPI